MENTSTITISTKTMRRFVYMMFLLVSVVANIVQVVCYSNLSSDVTELHHNNNLTIQEDWKHQDELRECNAARYGLDKK